MKVIIVNPTLRNARVKKKVQQELRWYDIDRKKMLFFTGGRLNFEYTYDDELKKYRMTPKVVDLEVIDYENKSNIDDIRDWAKNNLNYSNAEIVSTNDDGVVFSVPDDEIRDFVESLEDNRFEYNMV